MTKTCVHFVANTLAFYFALTTLVSAQEVLVFSSARSGAGDLFARIENEIKPLVQSPAPEGTARYDAKRNRVVYHRFIEDVAFLYSNEQKLLQDPNGDAPPIWSPTGKHIVYVHPETQKLYRASESGRDPVALTTGNAIDRYPCFSPNGERVAFARKTDAGWDLYSVAFDPSSSPETGLKRESVKRLTHRSKYVGHPSWSHDGSHIAFDTEFDGDYEIAILELASGKITRVTHREGNDLVPAWSFDNLRIAFAGEPKGSGNWDVWEVSLKNPSELIRVTQAAGYDGAPLYVPASALHNQ